MIWSNLDLLFYRWDKTSQGDPVVFYTLISMVPLPRGSESGVTTLGMTLMMALSEISSMKRSRPSSFATSD